MRIHHLNCGTMCPLGGHLFDGRTPGIGPAKLACHCLLIETEAGLVLVDTGFGRQDMAHPRARLSNIFIQVNRIRFNEAETALARIRELGFRAEDVRHIVLTHLDFDHAGGLSDFPQAQVHVFETEARIARGRHGLLRSRRYRPEQWQGSGPWIEYPVSGERWFGFGTVRGLRGLPPEILMVPLAGHTLGHCGVAVQGPDGWLLHAGDAYFYHGEMDVAQPHCTPGLRMYQTMMQMDRKQRLRNQDRLRDLIRGHSEIGVFCSHDFADLDRFA